MTIRRTRDDTFWVLGHEQLRCLVSARRQDIVDQLAARGPMSVREIATAIHARPSALYYHLRELLRVGLVIEDGHRVVRRKRESLYRSRAPRMRFQRAFQDPRNHPTFVRIAAAMARQMHRDFRNGIRAPDVRGEGPERNLGLFRLIGAPDARTLASINRHLDAVAELLWESAGGDGDVVSLAWVMAPANGHAPVKAPATPGRENGAHAGRRSRRVRATRAAAPPRRRATELDR